VMTDDGLAPELLRQIAQAVSSLRYGTVQITVHNARVVQIDKVERMRFTPPADLSRGRADTHPPSHRTSGAPRSEDGP
jgi:hypothetical protein